MKITDAFLGEHAVFYAQFAHIEQTVPGAECLCRVKHQAGLLAAALASHAHLEDDLLFVHLEPHLGAQAGPLAVMRAEHEEIENGLRILPDIDDLAEGKALFLRTVLVARQHFSKEEKILYPIAQQVLDEDTLLQLGEEWAELRSVSTRTEVMCHH